MKKVYLVGLIVLLSASFLSALPCMYINEKDAFSGKIKRQTYGTAVASKSTSKLIAGPSLTFTFIQRGENLFVTIALPVAGKHEAPVAPGLELMIKYEDDSVMTLKTAEETKPMVGAMGGVYAATVTTTFAYEFPITKKQLETFANVPFIAVKSTWDEERSFSFDAKRTKFVQKRAECLLEAE